MTPTININLTQCDCGGASSVGRHAPDCPGTPVLIPCPIPRSVTLEVRLGECFCTTGDLRYMPQDSGGDLHICPARPIRFTCSIGGETWEESEVAEVEILISPMSVDDRNRIYNACRALWGYLKSLVLGHSLADCPESIHNMRPQRDAVFAALAEMARAEDVIEEASHRAFNAFRNSPTIVRTARPSHSIMETYVEHLIEQVGVL